MKKNAEAIKRLPAIVLLGLFCVSVVVGCNFTSNEPGSDDVEIPATATTPDSYESLYDLLKNVGSSSAGDYSADNMMAEEGAGDTAVPTESEGTGRNTPQATAESDYSNTNVQVSGIDEADIVKTDGSHIFMIDGNEVVIVKAEGENTREIARITLDAQTLQKENPDFLYYPNELFINGNTLVVLYQYSPDYSTYDYAYSDSAYYYSDTTEVACFDITSPDSPQLITTFGQDGYYSTSRLYDNVLYVVSNYYVYADGFDRDDPITYIPEVSTGDAKKLIEPADILIAPNCNSTTYSVITSIDLSSHSRVDRYSVLGASDTLYMSYENLYLANRAYKSEELDSYQDGSFTVTEEVFGTSTSLTKLSLSSGTIEFVADTTVNGYLLNQFSLDEYNGNLRLVVTVDESHMSTIRNKDGDVVGSDNGDSISTNSLFILDPNLQVVGSIEGLAEDERVYSVRFDGEVGYFVTFRQTDPLFAVDLSDPANPQIKDALKIPGFSTYMHVYGTDRLFGLGMAADDDGRTEGLKMSMFDTTDPYNLSEIGVLELDGSYSEALYNHKAIFIDPEKSLIGFATNDEYVVYSYSDESGFYLVSKIENAFDSSYYGQFRGLYIDDYFYLCTGNNIKVYTLDGFTYVKSVDLGQNP